MRIADVVVIGGGIAGVSAAHFLASDGLRVALVEAEPALAHHTTGRSAAHFLENYGNDTVRTLTIAGRPFFADPPAELLDAPLWAPRPMLRVGSGDHGSSLREEATRARALVPSTAFLDADDAAAVFPPLRPGRVTGAILEPEAMEVDVAALHQLFVRGARRAGAEILPSARATTLSPAGRGWRVVAGDDVFECGVVVNAAGAWGDAVGAMAGLDPVGLHPLRRTLAVVGVPEATAIDEWPLVAFESGPAMDAYCKPESGGLLLSPADETPSVPCDARPEEVDIAIALDRLAEWTELEARHVTSSWAGLRTFTADRTPVAGFDPTADGFFWLVGQGGYGIQTAPGLGRVTAALIGHGSLPADVAAQGLRVEDLAADRPGLAGELVAGH